MNLVWNEDALPPTDRRIAIEEQVRNDIMHNLEDGLESPSDLVFHHVFLGEEMTDESVLVYGVEGSDAFHCAYHAITQWRPLSESEDSP